MIHPLLLLAATAAPVPPVPPIPPFPIVTAQDQRLIRARCGLDDRRGTNIQFRDGRLVCPDGRTFDDPQTRAMARAIERRAGAHAAAATRSAAIAQVQARRALAQARIALVRARAARD